MTRRRVFALISGALLAVFVVGSAIAIYAVRSQLIDDVDDSLATEVEASVSAINTLELDDLNALASPVNERAFYVIDELGNEVFVLPAGDVSNPTPPPNLPASHIIDRSGTTFGADGTDGGPSYRVATGRLENGNHIAIAQPLDDVRNTINRLTRILLLTLLGIIATLGVIFWWLLRRSLKPYESIVDTARAIAGGDLDRRAIDPGVGLEVEALTTSMNTMLDRIQASFEAKDAAENRIKQFAADASHELRTPISTIAGYSEVYLSGAATDTTSVDKQMSRINSEAQRMGRLVNDLLTLARLDQGRGLTFEPLDLRSLISDAVADAHAIESTHDIHVTTTDAIATVTGDSDALHQVYSNLLANTRIHAPGARVDVGIDTDDAHVTVVIADDGPGFTGDVASHVFDRFYRAEESRTSSVRSSGLGLSIVEAIIEAHGGTIAVSSELGTGTRFTITLPAVSRDTTSPHSGLRASSATGRPTDEHNHESAGSRSTPPRTAPTHRRSTR
ncbi:MAG: HAMP domain-containing histidine kinase [Sulfitobacter sp.]|nr:HAMP domain-containing histidine kinase [Sulfitobacter sp.]